MCLWMERRTSTGRMDDGGAQEKGNEEQQHMRRRRRLKNKRTQSTDFRGLTKHQGAA